MLNIQVYITLNQIIKGVTLGRLNKKYIWFCKRTLNLFYCRLSYLWFHVSLYNDSNTLTKGKTEGRIRQMLNKYNIKYHNLNSTDVQTNVVNRSSLRAPWQNYPYKNKHIEQHKKTHRKNQDVTDIQNKLFLCFGFLVFEL